MRARAAVRKSVFGCKKASAAVRRSVFGCKKASAAVRSVCDCKGECVRLQFT